jgi:glycosyltransferase involved in cell wall biosynthesis
LTADPNRPPPTFAVLVSFSHVGGVERMIVNLLGELHRRGWRFDLVVLRSDTAYMEELPAGIRIVRLGTRHSLSGIPRIARYLKKHRPGALLVAKDRAGRAALTARRLAGVDARIVVRLGTNLTTALQHKHRLQAWLRTARMRHSYRDVDRIVAVSRGVADDTRLHTGLPRERIEVIRNPVITPAMLSKADAPCPHPWLDSQTVPTVVGMGRLTRQKGFDVLLDAFKRLLDDRAARLIIIGDGQDRASLQARAERLGISEHLLMPGFQANPYPWLARADLFVLSSRWEGSPNALTEALALGVPCVATDCPSGPAEVLGESGAGPVVPVDDVAALSAAMSAMLADPTPSDRLRAAVAEYNVERSADRYLEVLGLPPYPERPA